MKTRLRHTELLQFTLNLSRECRAGLLSALCEFCRKPPQSLVQCSNILLQFGHICIIVVNGRKLPANIRHTLKYGGDASAIFLFEPINNIHTCLHLIKPCRIRVNALQIVPHFIRCLLQRNVSFSNHRLHIRKAVIISCDLIQHTCNPCKCRKYSDSFGTVLTEQIVCFGGVFRKFF